MKNKDTLNVSGHLEIYKVYKDGTEEQVFSDKNTITSGMGVGLGLLYAGSGAASINNFQIRYFQLGTSGDSRIGTNPWGNAYGVSETVLASALGQVNGVADYLTEAGSNFPAVTHELMDWDGNKRIQVGDIPVARLYKWIYGLISDNTIKRVTLNSVTYIMYVDRTACNDQTINEVGLFMENPLGYDPKRSNLVAYRPFLNIAKTSDFALIFKWTLNF